MKDRFPDRAAELLADESIADWVDGRLHGTELQAFDARMREDDAFRQVVEAHREFVQQLRGTAVIEEAGAGTGPALTDRILDAVEATDGGSRVLSGWRVVAVAALVVAASVFAWSVLPSSFRSTPAASDSATLGRLDSAPESSSDMAAVGADSFEVGVVDEPDGSSASPFRMTKRALEVPAADAAERERDQPPPAAVREELASELEAGRQLRGRRQEQADRRLQRPRSPVVVVESFAAVRQVEWFRTAGQSATWSINYLGLAVSETAEQVDISSRKRDVPLAGEVRALAPELSDVLAPGDEVFEVRGTPDELRTLLDLVRPSVVAGLDPRALQQRVAPQEEPSGVRLRRLAVGELTDGARFRSLLAEQERAQGHTVGKAPVSEPAKLGRAARAEKTAPAAPRSKPDVPKPTGPSTPASPRLSQESEQRAQAGRLSDAKLVAGRIYIVLRR